MPEPDDPTMRRTGLLLEVMSNGTRYSVFGQVDDPAACTVTS
jgi:hypothetical protein